MKWILLYIVIGAIVEILYEYLSWKMHYRRKRLGVDNLDEDAIYDGYEEKIELLKSAWKGRDLDDENSDRSFNSLFSLINSLLKIWRIIIFPLPLIAVLFYTACMFLSDEKFIELYQEEE